MYWPEFMYSPSELKIIRKELKETLFTMLLKVSGKRKVIRGSSSKFKSLSDSDKFAAC